MTKFFFNFQLQKNTIFGLFLTHSSNLGGAESFPQKIWHAQLDSTMYYVLVLCRNSEKPNDPIPKKDPNREQDGRNDRPYFTGTFWLLLGVQQVQQQ